MEDMNMKEMKQNVPLLRFPEFSEEWVEKELGEICTISKKKYNPLKDKENCKCIELEHISQNSGIILGYCDSREQKSIKNRFEIGDVLFGKLRPYLRKYWKAEFEGVCSSEVWVFKGQLVTNDYLYQLVKSDKFILIAGMSSGSKMPRSDWSYMSEFPFHIPAISEQSKIADFLSVIDERIDLLNQKKKMLETYKKGVMQKLFSQELRFKDENGNDYPDWQGQQLGRLFKISAGGDVSKENVSSIKIGDFIYPIYANTDKNRGLYGYSNRYKQEGNCITVTGRGNLGIAEARKEKFYPIVRLLVLRPRLPQDIVFFKEIINSMNFCVESTGVPQLTVPQISAYYVRYPSFNEQQKIANFLFAIDNKITTLNDKINNSQQYKKGLLQQMFV